MNGKRGEIVEEMNDVRVGENVNSDLQHASYSL